MDRKSFLNTLISPGETKVGTETKPAIAPVQQERSRKQFGLTSSLNPYTGSWTDSEVIHLLKRLSFGAVKEDVDYFKTLTFSQAVDEMLNTKNNNPGQPLKNYVPDIATTPTNDPDWSVAVGRTWVNT